MRVTAMALLVVQAYASASISPGIFINLPQAVSVDGNYYDPSNANCKLLQNEG